MESKFNKTLPNNASCASSSSAKSSTDVESTNFQEKFGSPGHGGVTRKQPDASKQNDSGSAKPESQKILPTNLDTDFEKSSLSDDTLNEKTLIEMGFKANEIDSWEDMDQPRKQDLYELLRNMIDNFIKPNVQIRIGDKSFNCHMMVLQCYSDFFMECSNEVSVELPIERISPKAFVMVYDWMLCAKPMLQREGILELFNAADFLRIKGLVDQCWVCLDDDIRFQEDTAFLLYLEARNFGLDMLQQLMLTRICKFFLTLVASKDFLMLSADEVCNLLSSNSIGVNSEAEVLMSAVRWLAYSWNDRQSKMLDIIKCVRFGLVPAWMLVAWQRETDCIELKRIVENPAVKKMIEDGLSYATTKIFYPNNADLVAYLERYNLTKPVQRQWICDHKCLYHCPNPNLKNITYEAFCEYLDMIRTNGRDYWKYVKMANEGEPDDQGFPQA